MEWDELLKNKFLEYTKKDGIYCDVGSCNGVFTSFFKDIINEDGFVYGFEPNSYNYDSIKYLNDKNCKIENLAISSKIDEINLYGINTNSQNHTSNITGYDMGFNPLPIIGKTKTTTSEHATQ
jgi:FkbM family methyltransferase